MDWYEDSGPMLRGRPIDVDFMGFRSDTFTLQRAGWQIAESRDHLSGDVMIAIRHPQLRMSGMSEGIPREYLFLTRIRTQDVTFQISIAVQYELHQFAADPARFMAVDATPIYQEIRREDLFTMPYFRPIEEGKDIFLRQATVDEIMQIALDKQEPEQAAIKARRSAEAKREDYRRGGDVKAKLIAV